MGMIWHILSIYLHVWDYDDYCQFGAYPKHIPPVIGTLFLLIDSPACMCPEYPDILVPLVTLAAGMKSMLNPFTNPGPDSPTETIQAEIDALRAFGANQMPDKHKEIDLLAKAYKELEGMG